MLAVPISWGPSLVVSCDSVLIEVPSHRFYPAPYNITPNRMLAQSALSPYLSSPVSSYQVCSCLKKGVVVFPTVVL